MCTHGSDGQRAKLDRRKAEDDRQLQSAFLTTIPSFLLSLFLTLSLSLCDLEAGEKVKIRSEKTHAEMSLYIDPEQGTVVETAKRKRCLHENTLSLVKIDLEIEVKKKDATALKTGCVLLVVLSLRVNVHH